MRARVTLGFLGLLYVLGGLLVLGYALVNLSDGATVALALCWLALFVILLFRFVRCRRCRWPLLLARRGRSIIPIGWVPERCAKCGTPTSDQVG